MGSAIWLTPYVVAFVFGLYWRSRRLNLEQAVREQADRAERAVAEERTRIARELHDAIGHSVAVMTVQTSAVRRLLHGDQNKERAALETVEATGREAMAEMRKIVGVLRSGDEAPDLAPPAEPGPARPPGRQLPPRGPGGGRRDRSATPRHWPRVCRRRCTASSRKA